MKHTTTDWNSRSIIVACDDRGFKIGVKARDKKLYVVRDMMIRQYSGYQIMMYFAKGIFEIKKSDNQRALFCTCFVDNVSHH